MYNTTANPDVIGFSVSYSGEPDDNKDNTIVRAVAQVGGQVDSMGFDYTTWMRRIRFVFRDVTIAQGAQTYIESFAQGHMEIGPLLRNEGGELLH